MEIIITNPEQGISNYSALVAWAKDQAQLLSGVIVTPDFIKAAKTDIAALRKLSKAAADTRIRVEREHARKITETVEQLKTISALFDEAATAQDKQVKKFEQEQKDKKERLLRDTYTETVTNESEIPFSFVFDKTLLNASVNDKKAIETIKARIAEREADIAAIRMLEPTEEREAQLIEKYKTCGSISETLMYNKYLDDRIEEAKRWKEQQAIRQAQLEAQKAETPVSPEPAKPVEPTPEPAKPVEPTPEPTITMTIIATMTAPQRAGVERYLTNNNIIYDIVIEEEEE